MSNKREKKIYDEGFKQHIVSLHESGKKLGEIAGEYGIHPTSVSNWVKYYAKSGSFKAKDNMGEDKKRIKELEKQVKEQQMELDILKKAMVVMLKN